MPELYQNNLTKSPFGYKARKIQTKSVATICAMYQLKCGTDISSNFDGIGNEISLYQCETTGYKFWRPSCAAGNEDFYKNLSKAWPNYYKTCRWEHKYARKQLKHCNSVLEIGCGPGHFLKSLEGKNKNALGIELNQEAIANKVTKFPVRKIEIEQLAEENPLFDAAYAFQVLEHIPDPCSLIRASLQCISDGGILMFSVPNNDHSKYINQEDAFDLPPHHIGHFNPDVCREIAKFFGLHVEAIFTQRSVFTSPNVSSRTKHNPIYRLLRLSAAGVMNLSYMALREPGENLLMVFRKPHQIKDRTKAMAPDV